ncbi:hypothetical protein J6590_086437, partial [Homalodisca vitripennis]
MIRRCYRSSSTSCAPPVFNLSPSTTPISSPVHFSLVQHLESDAVTDFTIEIWSHIRLKNILHRFDIRDELSFLSLQTTRHPIPGIKSVTASDSSIVVSSASTVALYAEILTASKDTVRYSEHGQDPVPVCFIALYRYNKRRLPRILTYSCTRFPLHISSYRRPQ